MESQLWRHKSAEERRKEAGRIFRGEEEVVVKAGTIRKVHEPLAIKDLAKVILEDEKAREQPVRGTES